MLIFEMAREVAVVSSAAAVIGWDEETYLPPAGAKYRGEQLAWLSAHCHKLATSNAWRGALETAEAGDTGGDATLTANLREIRRSFDLATKLTVELVSREALVQSQGKQAWAAAREKSDFSVFAPHLAELVEIAREKAELWGYGDEPYDALLGCFERGARTLEVAALFDGMRPVAREIAAGAVARSAARSPSLPAGPYPVAQQQEFNAQVAESIGFDFTGGRIDTTTHPFCTTLGPHDIRLTTRYMESDFTSSLFGVLHEAGHGMYEQGLPAGDFGLPSGSPVSLSIHESQSRLWENHVGRSRGFWERWYPVAQGIFPQLAGFPLEKFLSYLWRAEFTPIRVEADEATYDMHILLRFELERRMVSGSLKVAEVPAAWNESYRELFGTAPVDDRRGCLQDIHWAMGGLGYFPTYTLGNINSAQLFAAAQRDPTVAKATAQADYLPLLEWLRKSIHSHGATLDPAALMQQATGSVPATADYLAHLRSRYL